MTERLRKALEHIEALPEREQETLADIIEEMWQTAQEPPFNPADVPQEHDDFAADMEEIDRIRGKLQRAQRS